MSNKKDTSNSGIIIGDGGSISAETIVTGDHNTLNVKSEKNIRIGTELDELRQIFSEATLDKNDEQAAQEAIKTLEEESEKGPQANGATMKNALSILEGIGKASSSLFPLADRLFPLLTRIGNAIF